MWCYGQWSSLHFVPINNVILPQNRSIFLYSSVYRNNLKISWICLSLWSSIFGECSAVFYCYSKKNRSELDWKRFFFLSRKVTTCLQSNTFVMGGTLHNKKKLKPRRNSSNWNMALRGHFADWPILSDWMWNKIILP